MPGVEVSPAVTSDARLNVTDRLTRVANELPEVMAIACRSEYSTSREHMVRRASGAVYATTTFEELEADVTRIASGLVAWGVPPGTRLALLVRPGIEFVTLVFALLRSGMVIVLVDPGLGKRHLIRCLADAKPEGFVAVPAVQAVRLALRHKFPHARWNVTVGRRWFWGGMPLQTLRRNNHGTRSVPTTKGNDPAAIIFTSGSTGPPKGVLYTQQMFETQVAEIQAQYGIEPGGIDLACFPLFALFNAAMGVTTIFPEMDFSRPAAADPTKLLAAANDWRVTQAFASPAVWRNVGNYCEQTGRRIESLRQVFSCGAPVGAEVLRKTLACVASDAKMHTPYGATECLPVSTIEAAEVLNETVAKTDEGAGVCVGRKFGSIQWRVIPITDEPIGTIDDDEQLSIGHIGELIVRGPQVSPEYVTGPATNVSWKIGVPSTEYRVLSTQQGTPLNSDHASSPGVWHRTGDIGYLDEQGRFWYCGRKSHRVETSAGALYTECVEAVFNKHPAVQRSALVGVGPRGNQRPVMILETDRPLGTAQQNELRQILLDNSSTVEGEVMVVDWPLPVDVRHNAKINREKLAGWAAKHVEPPGAPRSGKAWRSHAERGNEG